jgi:ParB family transcriptional regulator, chromosome partitioning protein
VAKFGLGKGLDALITDSDMAQAMSEPRTPGEPASVPIGKLKPNPNQPRKDFDPGSLGELAESIRSHGVIQPIIVEEDGSGGYIIVAGERRFRAASLAGLEEVPVIVRKFSEGKKLEIALIENIQREDLNPIEEAQAYRNLMELTSLTQEEVSERVGKNRSTVANSLRLLKLPEDIVESIRKGEVSAGHARAILSLVNPADQRILYKRIIDSGLSVRETERDAQNLNGGIRAIAGDHKDKKREKQKIPEIAFIEQAFIDALGTKVKVSGNGKKGKIQIEYYSTEDLERVLGIIAPDSHPN